MNQYLKISPAVQKALDEGRPVIALESTIISHGMPYPQNLETARMCEAETRKYGVEPATVAVIHGQLCAGLTDEELEYLARTGPKVTKASRRDLPILVARKADGATTVAATMIIAHMAGIRVFATGGIGGVHRNGQDTMDVSADLDELSKTVKANSLCGLGQTSANPIISTLTHFRDEYIAHIVDKKCPAKVCKNLMSYVIDPELCKKCSLCSRRCPVGAISGKVKETPFEIDQSKCIKCGMCLSSCKFGAIFKK